MQDKTCHRNDQGQCFSEEHRYYEATHNGLDAMMRRFIRELKLLAADDIQDLNFTSERIDFIYQASRLFGCIICIYQTSCLFRWRDDLQLH
eukprot:791441-Pelagomonas_calceolata.AAC.3